MRVRWLIPLIVVIVAAAALAVRFARSEAEQTPASREQVIATDAGLPERVIPAGAVMVAVEPLRLDETGAAFRVVMETHSEELSVDLARTSTLEVDGVEWTSAAWSGDPPGGHHRSGELTFDANGAAAGTVTLTIDGFGEPVEATWMVGT